MSTGCLLYLSQCILLTTLLRAEVNAFILPSRPHHLTQPPISIISNTHANHLPHSYRRQYRRKADNIDYLLYASKSVYHTITKEETRGCLVILLIRCFTTQRSYPPEMFTCHNGIYGIGCCLLFMYI